MKIILSVLILMAFSATLSGQTEATTWQTQSIQNLRSGEVAQYSCQFKIYPGNKIEWIQSGGSSITVFQIASTEGELPEIGNGKITYMVVKEELPGKIIIERNGPNAITLQLDLSSISSISAYYQFDVTKN